MSDVCAVQTLRMVVYVRASSTIANIAANRRAGYAVSEFDTICLLALRNDE